MKEGSLACANSQAAPAGPTKIESARRGNNQKGTKMMKRLPILLLFVVFAFATNVGAGEKPVAIGMIPDAGATQVSIQEKAPLKDYLAKQMSSDVNLVIPTNYNATVEALGNGSLDFVYLGGLTYVKAHKQYGVV